MTPEIQARITAENAERGRKNRKYGEGFEIRCLAKVKRSKGCLNACRSAGSRGLFDVFGYYKGYIRCIVCKTNGYIEPSQRRALKKFFNKVKDNPFYRIEIHSKDEKKRRIIEKRVRKEDDIA